MGIRQPVVHGYQTHLGAIANERNTKAILSTVELNSWPWVYSVVQVRASVPVPKTWEAAKYSRMVPNRAWAMPTPHRIKYFQAASMLSGVRYKLTKSTVANVAPSIATHRTPKLLLTRIRYMASMKPWYMA